MKRVENGQLMVSLRKLFAVLCLVSGDSLENQLSQLEATQLFERLGREELLHQKLGEVEQILVKVRLARQLIQRATISIINLGGRILQSLFVTQQKINRNHKIAHYIHIVAPF